MQEPACRRSRCLSASPLSTLPYPSKPLPPRSSRASTLLHPPKPEQAPEHLIKTTANRTIPTVSYPKRRSLLAGDPVAPPHLLSLLCPILHSPSHRVHRVQARSYIHPSRTTLRRIRTTANRTIPTVSYPRCRSLLAGDPVASPHLLSLLCPFHQSPSLRVHRVQARSYIYQSRTKLRSI